MYSREHCKKDSILAIFLLSSSLFAILLFLYGFFPVNVDDRDIASKNDFPSTILNVSVDRPSLFRRHIGRLVFVVIDAFRWDLMKDNMPYTSRLIKQKHGSLLTARCHPPTATMPRVKALMTGSVPNYIDVVFNLGSSSVKGDSFIHQAVENEMKLLFYGDETWLHLFPGKFLRSEGTTSFFVSDYTEVDLNVTRHLDREMKQSDWDVLFLHYLGLDHIGHLAGPSSRLIPPKLKEMDEVVQLLHAHLQKWDTLHPEEPSLLVVVGDHGMHDSGSHGGATLGEVLVSLVFVGKGCHATSDLNPEVSQIDITATLAVLLGLPLPRSSVGALIPHALGHLSDEEYLYALYYNAYRVGQQFINADPDWSSTDSYKMFTEAQKLHASWIQSGASDLRGKVQIQTLYTQATNSMSATVVNTSVTFDVLALVVVCLLLLQVVVLVSSRWVSFQVNQLTTNDIIFSVCVSLLFTVGGFVICTTSTGTSIFCSSYVLHQIVTALTVLVLTTNTWLLSKNFFSLSLSSMKLLECSKCSLSSSFLSLGSILHTISLSASSLIEEEHQTWYFLWTSLGFLSILSVLRKEKTKDSTVICSLVALLVAHRFLRKLNQTGDKWASLPDISDWLNEHKNMSVLSSFFMLGLLGVWLSAAWLKCLTSTLDKVVYSAALVCVFLYRTTIGDVIAPFYYRQTRGTQEVCLFWFTCVAFLSLGLRKLKCQHNTKPIINALAATWLLLIALLMRPHNAILVPAMVFASWVLHRVFPDTTDCSLAHSWLGAVGFFYQGNSNSLATIDVTAGYVGAERYELAVAGILVAIHTLSAPITAIFLLWIGLFQSESSARSGWSAISASLQVTFQQRLLPLLFYLIIAILHRHHLFIWSVFAPKLLYESAISIVVFLTLLVCHVCYLKCSK